MDLRTLMDRFPKNNHQDLLQHEEVLPMLRTIVHSSHMYGATKLIMIKDFLIFVMCWFLLGLLLFVIVCSLVFQPLQV